MKRALPLVLVAMLAFAGCGGKATHSASPSGAAPKVHLAKTKFVIHAGLAFGAFHHWISGPFRKGYFSHPLRHKLAVAKAIAAGLFVRHEVGLALKDARSSRFLSKVVLPLAAVGTAALAIRAALRAHHAPSTASVDRADSNVNRAEAASRDAGQPITETTPAHI